MERHDGEIRPSSYEFSRKTMLRAEIVNISAKRILMTSRAPGTTG